MQKNFNVFKHVDKPILILYLLLTFIGWFNIYGASVTDAQGSIFDLSYRSGMQFLWINISFIVAIFVLLINSRFYSAFSTLFYCLAILLLIATIFLAKDIKGSRSWISIGSFSIQPAEFAKFITALMLAKVMSKQSFKLQGIKNYSIVISLILLPMLIIIMQKETGSALVFSSFIFMLYREGLPGVIPLVGVVAITLFILVIKFCHVPLFAIESAPLGLFIGMILIIVITLLLLYYFTHSRKPIFWISVVSAGIILLSVLVNLFIVHFNIVIVAIAVTLGVGIYLLVLAAMSWRINYLYTALFVIFATVFCYSSEYIFNHVLEPHQRIRIEVMLGMKEDPTGAGYNVNQAKIAIGSGGMWGKGYLQGTQTKLKYVPEQDTDFIFCTIGEEFGFVGSTMVIVIYLLFLFRIIYIAERQQDKFVRIYGYGVMGIFAFHLMINIGMVLGLAPVIGIPLPFFSYGGSSFLSFTILLFILLRLDTFRIERTK